MAEMRGYKIRAALWGLGLSAAAAAVARYFDPVLGTGILMGGVAGTVGFWMLATGLEQVAGAPREHVVVAMYRGVFVRLAVYGAVLVAAYGLDPVRLRGLVGAAAGLVGLRTLLVLVGLAGVVRRRR